MINHIIDSFLKDFQIIFCILLIGGGTLNLKERDGVIRFLHDLTPIRRSEGLDLNHPYMIQLPKSTKLVDDYKISVLSDSMFKTMFFHENRLKYSCKFISYFLDITYEELLGKLRLGKSELDKKIEHDKGERCDYVAYIQDSIVNIEINMNHDIGLLERNLDYAWRLFIKLIRKGTKYKYTQVVQFNVCNFGFKELEETFYFHYIQNNQNVAITDKLIFVLIFVPNLMKKLYNDGIEKLTEAERFILTIVLPNVSEAQNIAKGFDIMEEFVKEAIDVGQEDDLRESYDKEWTLKDQGYREGLEDAMKKTATNLKQAGIDLQLISSVTGLSLEEIEGL